MAKISWSQALADYLKDETASYAVIAEKHGVSKQAVVKRAVKENWQELRKRTLLEVDQKLPDKISETVAEIRSRHASYGRMLLQKGLQAIQKDVAPDSFRDALALIVNGVKIEKDSLRLDADERNDPNWDLFQKYSFIFSLNKEELQRLIAAGQNRIANELP